MNYNKMIRGGNVLLEKIEELKKFTAENQMTAPTIDHDQLDTTEAEQVMEYILKIKEEYFSGIEMSSDVVKNFIYNIPRPIYNSFMSKKLKEEIDLFNPIFFLFPFLLKDPEDVVMFVDVLNNLIGPDESDYMQAYKNTALAE